MQRISVYKRTALTSGYRFIHWIALSSLRTTGAWMLGNVLPTTLCTTPGSRKSTGSSSVPSRIQAFGPFTRSPAWPVLAACESIKKFQNSVNYCFHGISLCSTRTNIIFLNSGSYKDQTLISSKTSLISTWNKCGVEACLERVLIPASFSSYQVSPPLHLLQT